MVVASWSAMSRMDLPRSVSLVLGSAGAAVDQVPPRHVLDAAAHLILVVGGAALLLRRRWPAAFFGSEVVLSSVYLARGYPNGPLLTMVGVAAFVFASRRGIWMTLAAAVPAAVVLVVADLVGYAQTGISGRVGAVAQAPLGGCPRADPRPAAGGPLGQGTRG